METFARTARRLLRALYDYHRSVPHGSAKARDLLELLGIEDEALFFDSLQRLHDDGFVEGEFLPYERQGYMDIVRITPRGVDLLDDPEGLDRAFPVDSGHLALEAFVDGVSKEAVRAGMTEAEREELLLMLNRLVSRPASSGVLSRALLRLKEPGWPP
jgi:hypothetical protein